MNALQVHAKSLGFAEIGVAGVDLSHAEPGLLAWLNAGFHGGMGYMAAHGLKRARPAELVPGTLSVITARMDYLPRAAPDEWQSIELQRPNDLSLGTVSAYARGRDYHKVLRKRLQQLADHLQALLSPLQLAHKFQARAFTDSAPVLEAELATQSGLGWRGKHSLVLSREAGSMFFLGEIFVNIALPTTAPTTDHCGSCNACMSACPTQAIVAPGVVDARRCISYLTIEHAGPIPLEFRAAVGNRIYGCDDCQTACPWNKFAQRSPLADFDEREGVNAQPLADLLGWTEAEFLKNTEGSAIRRIGFARWQRNLCVAAGNALRSGREASQQPALIDRLQGIMQKGGDLAAEHAAWALELPPKASAVTMKHPG